MTASTPKLLVCALLTLLPACAAAETISNFNATLTTSNATELGRPSRSGIQQTWLGGESYAGILNASTSYYYNTYTFASSLFTGAPYVEISVYDPQGTGADFLVAYAGAYNLSSRATGWLGDEGGSGDYYGATDARYFDVILPANQALVLVLNNTSPGLGLNDPINIEVDAYADTDYDDPTPAATTVTPEPASLVTLGTGLLSVLGMARRRRARSL